MMNYEDYEHKFEARLKRRKPSYQPKKEAKEIKRALVEEKTEQANTFTYLGSRFEREWIRNYLSLFYNEHLITDVLRLVKGGKEASVYCCAAHPNLGVELLAAKIYRPRQFRQLRNDALYRQGRKVIGPDGKEVVDFAELKALARGTTYGKELQQTSWLAHEYETLQMLRGLGAQVPQPYACGENALLMTYLGEVDAPAPTLNQVELPPAEARPLFERLLHNVELMLKHNRVHGDLSAYNVLYWEGEVMLIDFPQVIDPYVNRRGRMIFTRDLTRLCDYFARYGVAVNAKDLADSLWTRHVVEQEELPPEEE